MQLREQTLLSLVYMLGSPTGCLLLVMQGVGDMHDNRQVAVGRHAAQSPSLPCLKLNFLLGLAHTWLVLKIFKDTYFQAGTAV